MNELANNSKIAYESPKIEIFLTQAQSVICSSTESINQPIKGTWGTSDETTTNMFEY